MAYQLKLHKHWLIHNAFHVSLLKPYKGEPPNEAITEDPPDVEGQEEVLQPESVLRHEDKVLRNGKIIRRYLIKFKNYPFEDAKWMQGTQLKDSLHLVNAYNDSLENWDDTAHPIAHTINVPLSLQDGNVKYLADVLHVPNITKNLVSIGQMVEQGLQVRFNADSLYVEEYKKNGKLIAQGKKVGRMFTLDVNIPEVNAVMFAHGSGVVADIEIWHKRIGHANVQRLKTMQSQELVTGLPVFKVVDIQKVCEACQFGKQAKASFPHDKHVSINVLELEHSDVWGLGKTASMGGCRFYVTFIDDHTRKEHNKVWGLSTLNKRNSHKSTSTAERFGQSFWTERGTLACWFGRLSMATEFANGNTIELTEETPNLVFKLKEDLTKEFQKLEGCIQGKTCVLGSKEYLHASNFAGNSIDKRKCTTEEDKEQSNANVALVLQIEACEIYEEDSIDLKAKKGETKNFDFTQFRACTVIVEPTKEVGIIEASLTVPCLPFFYINKKEFISLHYIQCLLDIREDYCLAPIFEALKAANDFINIEDESKEEFLGLDL
ncbi:hypothetical protein L7F22_039570 [Adiantum nelumboides]|nr:hypothetical protein [Adiantum nelumboides]